MNYKQLEDRLFDEWRQRSITNGDGDELAPDGLLYRGRFVYRDGYWSREPGGEDSGEDGGGGVTEDPLE